MCSLCLSSPEQGRRSVSAALTGYRVALPFRDLPVFLIRPRKSGVACRAGRRFRTSLSSNHDAPIAGMVASSGGKRTACQALSQAATRYSQTGCGNFRKSRAARSSRLADDQRTTLSEWQGATGDGGAPAKLFWSKFFNPAKLARSFASGSRTSQRLSRLQTQHETL